LSARRTRKQVYQEEIDRCSALGDSKGMDFWSNFLCEAELEGIENLPAPFDIDDQGNIVSLVHLKITSPRDEAEA
jgi:hypothetical protein